MYEAVKNGREFTHYAGFGCVGVHDMEFAPIRIKIERMITPGDRPSVAFSPGNEQRDWILQLHS